MDLKEFFKPTKWKAIVFGLVILATAIFFWAISDCFTMCSNESGYFGCSLNRTVLCDLPMPVLSAISFILVWPFSVAVFVMQASGITEGTDYSLIGLMPRVILLVAGIMANLAWFWVIACAKVKLIKKFRKR